MGTKASMLGLAALLYLVTLFASMFGLAFRNTERRDGNRASRSAETGGFEPPRELSTP